MDYYCPKVLLFLLYLILFNNIFDIFKDYNNQYILPNYEKCIKQYNEINCYGNDKFIKDFKVLEGCYNNMKYIEENRLNYNYAYVYKYYNIGNFRINYKKKKSLIDKNIQPCKYILELLKKN